MSILIKGMEMPRRGMVVNIYGDGRVTNHFDESGKTIGKAVPVPPHGRLIDADAVSLEGGPYEYDEWCKWALIQYQDAPTVIEAEKET